MYLVLIKNPVGATQAIEMIKLAPYPSACPFFSMRIMQTESIRAGFGMQISSKSPKWTFQRSTLAECATLRLLDDFGSLAILQKRSQKWLNLKEVFQRIQQQETPHAYILATYTAMLEFRELLAQEHLIEKEMH